MNAPTNPVTFAIRFTPPVALACSVATFLLGERRGAIAFLTGAGLSILSLCAARWAVTKWVHGDSSKRLLQSRLQLLLAGKLPFFAIAVFFAFSLGASSILHFLAGYLLVYLSLLLGAILGRSAPASCE